jgi:hypothetical protein
MVENIDGWMFTCKLCGKPHEVPEEIAPYWRDARTLAGIQVGDMTLGCSEVPETAQYSMSDFTPFRVAA